MAQMTRRRALQLIAATAVAPLAWAEGGGSLFAAESSAATNQNKSEWMDEWIRRWKEDGREVQGLLYLGRFADPTYFLTKEIVWRPNADQDRNLPQVKVPVGFVTDFASIPRAFWSLLRPDGDYAYAAVIHDYLYWTQPLSRKQCDQIFKLAMLDFKVGEGEVQTIHTAVRAGGSGAWKENAKLKKQGEKRVLRVFPTDPTARWNEYKKRPDVF